LELPGWKESKTAWLLRCIALLSIPPAGPGPKDPSYNYTFSLIKGENAGRIVWVVRGNYQVFIAQVNPVYITVFAATPTNSVDASGRGCNIVRINNNDIAGSDCGLHGVVIFINLDGQQILVVAAAYSWR